MTHSIKQREHGFTIIELLIATTVFSVILLLITLGILHIGKSYYQASNQSRTQQVTRNILDEVSQAIQFSGSSSVVTGLSNGSVGGVCINGMMYDYHLYVKLDPSVAANSMMFQAYPVVNCSAPGALIDFAAHPGAIPSSRELLTQNMRLLNFTVTPMGSSIYTITLTVASGNDNLFTPTSPVVANSKCAVLNIQFCAISTLTTTVVQRLQ